MNLKEILEKHIKWLSGEHNGEKANLSGADLRDANLNDADLRYANLSGADLSGAGLHYVNLSGADLSYTNLSGAGLRDANLRCADLHDANLSGADLRCADLRYANLRCTDLRDADLSNANTSRLRGMKILSVDNIGTYGGKATYIPLYDIVFAGCWKGNLEQFFEKGMEMNESDEKEQRNIKLAYEFFKNNSGE